MIFLKALHRRRVALSSGWTRDHTLDTLPMTRLRELYPAWEALSAVHKMVVSFAATGAARSFQRPAFQGRSERDRQFDFPNGFVPAHRLTC